MKRLDLSDEEAELLAADVSSCLSDLRMEIAGTDSQDHREMLKRRETMLRDLSARPAA